MRTASFREGNNKKHTALRFKVLQQKNIQMLSKVLSPTPLSGSNICRFEGHIFPSKRCFFFFSWANHYRNSATPPKKAHHIYLSNAVFSLRSFRESGPPCKSSMICMILSGWWLNEPILKNMRKSNWMMSPHRDEHTKSLKPPPCCFLKSMVTEIFLPRMP